MVRLAILIAGILFHPMAAFGGLAVDDDGADSPAKRVALIIGNSAYLQERGRLRNPVNDARAIAAKLRALAFDVVEATDLDRRGMQTALRQFDRELSSDVEAALFFYAGHAMEYRRQNYLFPVDAELEAEPDIKLGLVHIADILEIMRARDVPTRLIFLDACRENPLTDRLVRSISAEPSRGLAVINAPADTARGTFIAYATAPGDVAEDGDGDHSPFTAALLEHLETPGLDADDLMENVRISVAETTNEAQIPWSSSSLRGDFVFNRGLSEPAPSSVAALTDEGEDPPPPEPPGSFELTLSLDDKYKVQEALSALGYQVGGSYISEFRSHIRNAIVNWQRRAGTRPSGYLTEPDFQRLLEEAGLWEGDRGTDDDDAEISEDQPPRPPPIVDPEEVEAALLLTRRERIELQFSLSHLDLYDGRLDGIFGDRSREAIGSWQRRVGWADSGYLTEVQVASLYAAVWPALEAFRESYRPPGGTFRDCTSCPDMVVIPRGRFSMGSKSGGSASERPARTVDIEKFALGKFEVTSEEWSACAGDGACRSLSATNDRHPVVGVTWRDTQDYVNWLRRKTGEIYYLPSEAEWEYAARAGTETVYAMGNRISFDDANFDGSRNSPELADRFRGGTLVGGVFSANAFGLHDMHGNVREWVQDRWHDSYRGAPRDGRAWLDGDAAQRIQRGGGWRDDPRTLRSAARIKANPDAGNAMTGFRVARKIGN